MNPYSTDLAIIGPWGEGLRPLESAIPIVVSSLLLLCLLSLSLYGVAQALFAFYPLSLTQAQERERDRYLSRELGK